MTDHIEKRPSPLASGWADTEPAEERAARELAWQEYRSCRDCKHWEFTEYDKEEDGTCIGSCMLPIWNDHCASFMAPEDYTCKSFEYKV